MNLTDLICSSLKTGDKSIQFIHESCSRIEVKKATKNTRAASIVTFATDPNLMQPSDLMRQVPRFIGVVVWIPSDEYESLVNGAK